MGVMAAKCAKQQEVFAAEVASKIFKSELSGLNQETSYDWDNVFAGTSASLEFFASIEQLIYQLQVMECMVNNNTLPNIKCHNLQQEQVEMQHCVCSHFGLVGQKQRVGKQDQKQLVRRRVILMTMMTKHFLIQQ
jgi:hypothetical protein